MLTAVLLFVEANTHEIHRKNEGKFTKTTRICQFLVKLPAVCAKQYTSNIQQQKAQTKQKRKQSTYLSCTSGSKAFCFCASGIRPPFPPSSQLSSSLLPASRFGALPFSISGASLSISDPMPLSWKAFASWETPTNSYASGSPAQYCCMGQNMPELRHDRVRVKSGFES